MNKILFLQLIGLLYLVSLSQQQAEISSTECNRKGFCATLFNCPAFIDGFVFSRFEYCDLKNSILCCLRRIESGFNETKADHSTQKSFERKCKEYNDQVFSNCAIAYPFGGSITGAGDYEPQELIVGGTKAEPSEFPHMALLGATQEDNSQPIKWMCGGSLISPKYVLSAANCFNDNPIPNYVRLGELDYNTTSDRTETQNFVIKSYTEHPQYDYEKNYNDIVLVELDKEAQLNRYVAPVCLSASNANNYTHFIAAGWGGTKTSRARSSHLQKVRLQRLDDANCRQKIYSPYRLPHGIDTRTQFCAGSNNSNTCIDDLGGPLFVPHPKHSFMYELVGIASFSVGRCGFQGLQAVYVGVDFYVDWIDSIVWDVGAK